MRLLNTGSSPYLITNISLYTFISLYLPKTFLVSSRSWSKYLPSPLHFRRTFSTTVLVSFHLFIFRRSVLLLFRKVRLLIFYFHTLTLLYSYYPLNNVDLLFSTPLYVILYFISIPGPGINTPEIRKVNS